MKPSGNLKCPSQIKLFWAHTHVQVSSMIFLVVHIFAILRCNTWPKKKCGFHKNVSALLRRPTTDTHTAADYSCLCNAHQKENVLSRARGVRAENKLWKCVAHTHTDIQWVYCVWAHSELVTRSWSKVVQKDALSALYICLVAELFLKSTSRRWMALHYAICLSQ